METPWDRSKSLQELEGEDWGEPEYDSHLVRTCHRLRRKPLAEFTVEDLRILIGQNIGLPYLIPIALEHLETDPLVSGDFHSGDLLKNVLSISSGFWQEHPVLVRNMEMILNELAHLNQIVEKEVVSAVEAFRQEHHTANPGWKQGQFVEFDGMLAVIVGTEIDSWVPEDHVALWFGEPRTVRKSQGGSGGEHPEVWTVPAQYCLPAADPIIKH